MAIGIDLGDVGNEEALLVGWRGSVRWRAGEREF
jgi:hypothetical protein